ncbi:unnamed protein product [Tuber aestivum]|uniref:Uncharacterized protein n=1 Tax=Tuber aestivum TaxID=59557 RepID=A0A292PL48_9PEZI|nr:unnamed protein product [Tuber aestivum]
MKGPYSSLIQNPPSGLRVSRTSPSGSNDTRTPPGPSPPKPSPGNFAAGRFGKSLNGKDVVGSRPEMGLPAGSLKRVVSKCFVRISRYQ